MRPGIKFYTKLEETSLEPKKYNKELKEAGLSGKDILFTERKEHSGNYIVFFENNGIYEYHPYDNINGLASGQKARTLEGCISRAHCMGLFENDTGVAKQMKAADGLLDVKVNFKESLRNRLREKMYTDELSDQLESDILSAANENADGPHVVLIDVLETLEYEFGYNYKGELYPNLSVIVKYLEQAGYIVEE